MTFAGDDFDDTPDDTPGNIRRFSGLTEEQIGLRDLREAAARILGDEPMSWWISYRVRVAIK